MIIVGAVKSIRFINEKAELEIEEMTSKRRIKIEGKITDVIKNFQTNKNISISKLEDDQIVIINEKNNVITSCITASVIKVKMYCVKHKVIPNVSETLNVSDDNGKHYKVAFDENTVIYDSDGSLIEIAEFEREDEILVVQNVLEGYSDVPNVYAYLIILL